MKRRRAENDDMPAEPRAFLGTERHLMRSRCIYCGIDAAACVCVCVLCGERRKACKCSGELYAVGIAQFAVERPRYAKRMSDIDVRVLNAYRRVFIERNHVSLALDLARDTHRVLHLSGGFRWCILCNAPVLYCPKQAR